MLAPKQLARMTLGVQSFIYSLDFVVRRLNAVLEEYQKKYLPVKEPDVKVRKYDSKNYDLILALCRTV